MRKVLSTIFVLAAVGYLVYLVCSGVILTVREVEAGHGRSVLMFWTLMVGAVGLSEFFYFFYLTYVPSTFSDHHAIDEIPRKPRLLEIIFGNAKEAMEAFVGVAAFVLTLHSFLDGFAGIHDWRVTVAVWVFAMTGVLTWMLIVELYTRYAQSVFTERRVTPVPFAKR